MMKIPVFYSVPGTEAVRVEGEIVFRTAGDTMLKADIYLPAARGTYPVVLLVSGGSVNDWRKAAFYTSFARVLAAEGIAAVNYENGWRGIRIPCPRRATTASLSSTI